MRLFYCVLFSVLCFAYSLSASSLDCEAYSKNEMAECFVFMLKESFKAEDVNFHDKALLAKKVETCSRCGLPAEGNPCCVCAMCPYCGSKYAAWTGWHYPDCVCPYCGGREGYHLNCQTSDWEGAEQHDFQRVIELTTAAINKNSNNKDAYFNRGIAYFELGSFDEALNDYRVSNDGRLQPKSFYKAYLKLEHRECLDIKKL